VRTKDSKLEGTKSILRLEPLRRCLNLQTIIKSCLKRLRRFHAKRKGLGPSTCIINLILTYEGILKICAVNPCPLKLSPP
jgi:hypothetical protein